MPHFNNFIGYLISYFFPEPDSLANFRRRYKTRKWHLGVACFFLCWCSEKELQMSLPGVHWWCSDDCSSLSLSSSTPPSSIGIAFVFTIFSFSHSLSLTPPPCEHARTHTETEEFPYLSEPVPPFKMLTCLCWSDKWMTFVSSCSLLWSLSEVFFSSATALWGSSLFCCWFMVDRSSDGRDRVREVDWHAGWFKKQSLDVDFSLVDDWQVGSPHLQQFTVLCPLSLSWAHKHIEDTEEEKEKEEEQGQPWSCRDTLRCPCGSPVEEECRSGQELCNEQDQEVIQKKRRGCIRTENLVYSNPHAAQCLSKCKSKYVSAASVLYAAEMCEPWGYSWNAVWFVQRLFDKLKRNKGI